MEGLRMSGVIWVRLTYERNGVWGRRHDLGHEQHEDGQREQHGDTCRHKRVISFMFVVRSSISQCSDIFYDFIFNTSLFVLFRFEPFWKCGGSNVLVFINEVSLSDSSTAQIHHDLLLIHIRNDFKAQVSQIHHYLFMPFCSHLWWWVWIAVMGTDYDKTNESPRSAAAALRGWNDLPCLAWILWEVCLDPCFFLLNSHRFLPGGGLSTVCFCRDDVWKVLLSLDPLAQWKSDELWEMWRVMALLTFKFD